MSGLREFLNGREVTLPVSTLAKYKTSLQMIALGCLLAGPTGDALLPGLLNLGLVLLWLSALLTVITGYDYLRAGLRHMQSISWRYCTPSFFCKLVLDVVYWNVSFWSGCTRLKHDGPSAPPRESRLE